MELSPAIYSSLVRFDWYNKRFITRTLKKKFEFDGKKVLDFGCGTGSNCFLCCPENYLGVDKNKKRIKYANYINPGYRFEISDNKIDTPENYFDIILIIAVLHHISDDKISNIIKELKRILKYPSGKIVILEPCFNDEYLVNNYFMQLFDRGKYIRKQDEYLRLFENQGFKVGQIEIVSKLAYKEILFSASQKRSERGEKNYTKNSCSLHS